MLMYASIYKHIIMEATTEEKQHYLRDQIMPHYDPEQFALFLESDMKIPELDVEQLTMQTLQNVVLKFKQYKYYQKEQKGNEEKKSEGKSQKGVKIQYEKTGNVCTLFDYEFQEKIKSMQVEPFTSNLQVYVPRIDIVQTQGVFLGLGSRKQVWFVVKTNMDKHPVRRLEEDFVWLSETIAKQHPLQAIPELIDVSRDQEGNHEKRRKELEEYLQILVGRQQMQRSTLLYEFLTFPSQKIQKMKKNYDSISYVKALHSVKTSSGQIGLSLTNKLRSYTQSSQQYLKKAPKLHENISQSIQKVMQRLQQTAKELYKIVDYFAELHEDYSSLTNKHPQNTVNQYNQILININNLVHIFANDLVNRSKALGSNLREFSKIQINYDKSMQKLYKNVVDTERQYLDFKSKLNKKKERIYPEVSKWQVDEKKLDNRRLNKEEAFELMLPRETKLQIDQKRWLAFLYTNYRDEFRTYLNYSVRRYVQVYCTFSSQLLLNDKTYVEEFTKFIEESQKLVAS